MLVSARVEKRHVNRFGDLILGQIRGNPIFFSIKLVGKQRIAEIVAAATSFFHKNLRGITSESDTVRR